MNKNIYPCIWFNNNAKQAADFYCSVFPNSQIISSNPMVTIWELYDQQFMGLNGGAMFTPNASISFFVICDTNEEVDRIWNRLTEEGRIMMPLDKYDWSEHYGFLQDKFGVAWQIFKGAHNTLNQKIVPCFLFTGDKFGKANEAMLFYTKVFSPSNIDSISWYDVSEMQQEGIMKHAEFTMDGNVYKVMDGPGNHNFTFSEGLSFVINCDTQEQIDYYWNSFTKDGGEESMCGWCKDKFGVSWQVVPSILGKLMNDAEKSQRVMQAFMQMKKFDIQELLNA
nr:VOC family protein [Bacteroidota bacterium]